MADASTTLNPGAGGDVLDESLVDRSDGTSVKRARVALGDDAGNVLGANGYDELPVKASAPSTDERLDTMIELLGKINEHLAAMSGRLP